MKTSKFMLAIFAGISIAILYAGMTVLFVQQRNLGFQVDDLDANRFKNTDQLKGLVPATSSANTAFLTTSTTTTRTTTPTTTTTTTRTTPKTYVNATNCDSSLCKPPACRCSGANTPGSLPSSNTPQMILFAMDGGINVNNYQIYKSITDGAKTINGCPVKMTFFVSGEYTDYTMVQERSKVGHEIGDYSVTHQSPNTWWRNANRQQLEPEILGQKTNLNSKSSAPVNGWRSPFLEATETTYQILYENNFLYDSSLVTRLIERWWPYTLDYLPSAPCYLTNCPTRSYPGLWEVPLHVWSDGSTGQTCITFDQCLSSLIDGDENSVYNLFMQNFNMSYYGGKQPFIMFGTSLWFDEPKEDYRKKGLIKFLNEMMKLPDVYFVTASEAIEWTKNPIGLDKGPFPCSSVQIVPNVPASTALPKVRKVYKPAEPCNPSLCTPPNCRCTGSDTPGGLIPSNTPQMLLFTMDDGINAINHQIYKDLFDGVKNSNGCPVKTSYFVSGDNTDYTRVKEIKDRGHEIADHSVTHKYPISWWSDGPSYEDLEFEVLTQKSSLETKSTAQIFGWRNPFLASTENTFRVLADNNFFYDSSIATPIGVRWWPYTFDYLPTLPCQLKNCPNNSYPGLWEMPLNTWVCNDAGAAGAMFDDCNPYLVDQDSESVYNLFKKNFLLHYNDKKTPFTMFAHSFWFDEPVENYRKQGFIKFMNEVRLLPDVFFVSVKDAIQWTINPVGLDKKPFSC